MQAWSLMRMRAQQPWQHSCCMCLVGVLNGAYTWSTS